MIVHSKSIRQTIDTNPVNNTLDNNTDEGTLLVSKWLATMAKP